MPAMRPPPIAVPALAAIALVLLAACSDESGSPQDAPVADATDAPIGLDGHTDGPCPGCDAPQACASLVLDTRPVRTIALFEDGGRIHAARSFRVELGYDATPCEQFAMPTWNVVPANHIVGFNVHVFHPPGDCPGLPIRRTRVVTLRLDAGTWRLLGVGLATPPSTMVTVGPPPLVACAPGAGECLQDCDCTGVGARCLGGVGLGGPFQECATPCEADRDCGETGHCTSIPDGLALTCESGSQCGGPGDDCADGFQCAKGACVPEFVLSGTTRHECTCDSDCDAPLRCIQPTVPGRVARCEIPCPTAGAWCQGPHFCGTAAQDLASLAPSDSVCVSVGE